MKIRFIEREEIDNLKWDSCVHYAVNGNAYGYTWFLDNSCEHWGGLVEGDYESVFPLIWNTKLFGIHQLYQPYFCQQLGIYSVHMLSAGRIRKFMEAIPNRFRFINIQLNEQNKLIQDSGFSILPRPNFLLRLDSDYEDLAKNYSTNLKRNLKKAYKAKLKVTQSLKPETLVDMYKQNQGPKIAAANEKVYHMAHRIIYNAMHRGLGFLSGVENSSGDLIAAGFFLTSHSRIVNLIPSTTAEGRQQHAMPLMLDIIIRSNAGKPILLDFEGSSVPSIARFFKSFGAEDFPFYQVTRNNLPFMIKWMRPA